MNLRDNQEVNRLQMTDALTPEEFISPASSPASGNFTQKPVSMLSAQTGLDPDLIGRLDGYSLETVVEFKISRFLDQLGGYYPEDLHELIMQKVEKPLIAQILKRMGGNQVAASKVLGINRNTLRKKMKIYGL